MNDEGRTSARLDRLHRVGSAALGVGVATFGVLGFVNRLDFFSTQGTTVLGLSSNGLLSTISVVVGVVLVAAALRGGRLSSTTTVAVGCLFLVSGLVNVLLLETELNLLAFRMPNVIFSLVAGALLLILGSYGRFAGRLPDDNPYRRARHPDDGTPHLTLMQPYPENHDDVVANEAMTAAERAVSGGGGSAEQVRRVRALAAIRTHEERRAAWRAMDDGTSSEEG